MKNLYPKCPRCGYSYEDLEEYEPFISYWGEEGWLDSECPGCGCKFKILEHVKRTWTCRDNSIDLFLWEKDCGICEQNSKLHSKEKK